METGESLAYSSWPLRAEVVRQGLPRDESLRTHTFSILPATFAELFEHSTADRMRSRTHIEVEQTMTERNRSGIRHRTKHSLKSSIAVVAFLWTATFAEAQVDHHWTFAVGA